MLLFKITFFLGDLGLWMILALFLFSPCALGEVIPLSITDESPILFIKSMIVDFVQATQLQRDAVLSYVTFS